MANGSGCTFSNVPVMGIRTVCALVDDGRSWPVRSFLAARSLPLSPMTTTPLPLFLITDAQNRMTLNTTPTANTTEPMLRHKAKWSLNETALRSITSMCEDRPTTGSLAGIRWPAAIAIAPMAMTASPNIANAPLQWWYQRISGSTKYLKSSSSLPPPPSSCQTKI